MALIVPIKISKLIPGLALIFFLLSDANGQTQPSLELKDGCIWVNTLNEEVLYTFTRYHHEQADWQSVFPVRVKGAEAGITISGTYDVFETSVRFTPRFPFVAGVAYEVLFYSEQLSNNYNEVYLPKMASETLTLNFEHKKISESASFVKAIFPTADTLPENLLKFHISFSNAMTVGEIYKRIKIFDRANKEIEKAFLVVDQEFWDEEMTVATLLLDPGRIKRGLKANLEMNAPLKAGESYTLVIDKNWKDVNGNFLEAGFRKQFHCTQADRVSPLMNQWSVVAPTHTHDVLVIKTNEPMNMISLSNGLLVKDGQGQSIEGEFTFLKNETGVSFKPKHGWVSEKYLLHINPLMEDLAGNNMNRVFDKDLQVADQPHTTSLLSIPFSIGTVLK